MYISDLHKNRTDHDAVTKPYLDGVQKKALKREIEEIVDAEFDRLQVYANEYISDIAAQRAETFLGKVLAGDKDAAMALLGNANNSDRVRVLTDGSPWACIIHGSLFETTGIALRRKIVEAHTDLITSERIADLESIVSGLTKQVMQLQRLIDEHEA